MGLEGNGAALLSAIYDAAGGDEPWLSVVGEIASFVGTDGVDLVIRDEKTMELDLDAREKLGLGGAMDGASVATYARDFVFRDPLARAAYRWQRSATWLQQELVEQVRWTRTAVYNDWMRPNRLNWVAGSLSPVGHGLVIAIAAHRVKFPIQSEQRTKLEQVRPHLTRAVQLQLRLQELKRSELTAWAMLDELADAVFALDLEGAILYANSAGEDLRAHGLVGRGAPGRGRSDRRPSQRVKTPEAELLWTFRPVPPRLGRLGASALAFVTHPDGQPWWTDREFKTTFDLTPAESRLVCGLVAGASLQSIADRHGVSITTVRSQLRAVFQKTQTRRQSELVAKVAALMPRLASRKQ